MLSRALQAQVLRYWEEIELLTPPDYSVVESETVSVSEWLPGSLSGDERGLVARWQAARLERPYEYPADGARGLLAPDIPWFTVYVGIVEKRTVHERLIAELSSGSADGGALLDAALSSLAGGDAGLADMLRSEGAGLAPLEFSSPSSADAQVTGRTFLARFSLNPWGKYVDESFETTGFVGALRHLRAVRAARAVRAGEGETRSGDELIAGAMLRARRMERWLASEAAKALNQPVPRPGVSVKEDRPEVPEGAPRVIVLSDPQPDALAVPEGFVSEIAAVLARGAGLQELLPSAVRVEMRLPTARGPSHVDCMGSFFLGDLAEAREELLASGSEPFDAPDWELSQTGTAPADAAAECAAAAPALANDNDGAHIPADPDDGILPPLSGALGRFLAHGDGEGVPRIDLLRDPGALARLLNPARLPSGRWPADPSHHLYLAQQAAVAAILRAGEGMGPLVAVNGPPGTGKSWLLRDVVAEIVTRRARAIARKASSREVFDMGSAVTFSPSANELITFSPVVADVAAGSVIVVASTNNAAIRNITDALPRSYGLREPVRDLRTGGRRPAFSYWRDCALGLMALAVEDGQRRRAAAGRRKANAVNAAMAAGSAADDALSPGDPADPQDARALTAALAPSRPAAGGATAASPGEAALRVSREERFRELVGQVRGADEVWGLASATLGSRANCSRFVRAVMGLGARNPFGTSIEAQLADAADRFRLERRLPEDAWREAKLRFLELDRRVSERREAMAGRAASMRAAPAPFTTSLSESPQLHKTSLWVDEEFERMRSELFESAMELHAATLCAQTDFAKKGLNAAGRYLLAAQPHFEAGSARSVFEFLAFLVPVISTTLASAARLFAQVGPGELGWVFIDEAGQATPQSAVGMLNRARRAVILGDPRQLMPVVTMPPALSEFLRLRHPGVERCWSPGESSLQTLADATMGEGAEIPDAVSGRPVWTGLPLRTHRRSLSPMFEIANRLSYANQMVQMTPRVDDGRPSLSCWWDVRGESYVPLVRSRRSAAGQDGQSGAKSPRTDPPPRSDPKMIREEMAWLRRTLQELSLDRRNRGLSIFVLSPFRVVASGARRIIRELAPKHVAVRAGTVHAFQGQEADVVVLVLGSAPGMRGRGQRRWAAMPANLLNVAVTRARRDLIVIGDWGEWTIEPSFAVLAEALPRRQAEVPPDAAVFDAELRAGPSLWEGPR